MPHSRLWTRPVEDEALAHLNAAARTQMLEARSPIWATSSAPRLRPKPDA